MIQNQRPLIIFSRLVAAALTLFVFSIFSASVIAQEQTVPQQKPNAGIGLEIFAERCASCHGPTGDGDGELSVNLEVPPAAFSNPDFRKTAEPNVMFAAVFNGNFTAGMPPFGPGTENSNPISEVNIWDLIAGVYSLSTPAEAIGMGQAIYEQECVACHGESGAGDGPDAAGLDRPPTDLTDFSYWFSRSNEAVYGTIQGGAIPEHDYTLSEAPQWAVVDYTRTFGYVYAEPVEAAASIVTAASVAGTVRNGTTDEIVSGLTARLRAFTSDFQQTLDLTTTVGTDGRYDFDLELIPPDWIFLTSVAYGELSFSSDAAQISSAQTELDLPITVYERTTNSAAVSIEQMHLIVEFFDGRMAVSELFVFSNNEAAVFVGESGVVTDGTVLLSLPEDAENVVFERTLGSMDSTIPATEVIQTAGGWADTVPLRPGQGGLNLIVRYELPYDDGATLSHQILYDTASVTVIVPDVGVEVMEDGWSFQGIQQMSASSAFLTYERTNVPSGTALELNIAGRPEVVSSSGGTVAAARDPNKELFIGGGVFVLAAAAAFFIVRSWRAPVETEPADETGVGDDSVDRLIRAIASLDEEHERGELAEAHYKSQRERLKSELRALWG